MSLFGFSDDASDGGNQLPLVDAVSVTESLGQRYALDVHQGRQHGIFLAGFTHAAILFDARQFLEFLEGKTLPAVAALESRATDS